MYWLRVLNEPHHAVTHLPRKSSEEEMAGHRIAHATLKGPNLVKEIFMGITLGLAAGGLWKMHHWNEQRKTKTFYDMLERGQISVIAAEE